MLIFLSSRYIVRIRPCTWLALFGFLSNGVTRAGLKHAGTNPSRSGLFIIFVIGGLKSSTHLENRECVIGPKSQDFEGAFKLIH